MAELERWEELSEELERAGDSSGPFDGSAMSYYVHAFARTTTHTAASGPVSWPRSGCAGT